MRVRVKKFLSQTVFILLISLLILVFLEGGLRIIYHFKKGAQGDLNPYYSSGVILNSDYAKALWQDFKKQYAIPMPYVHWIYGLQSSQNTEVQANGLRKTYFNSTDPKARKVFCFGGSTLWGTGAEDKETTPSHLAKILNQKGPFVVMNYGQSAYFSTQQTVALSLERLKGNIPDVVLFYDGANDSYVGGYSPGDPYQFEHYEAWEKRFRKVTLKRYFSRKWDRSTLHRLLEDLGLFPNPKKIYDQKISDEDIKQRAEVLVAAYLRNVGFVKKLSHEYGFKAYFFWQPSLLAGTKKTLSPHEEKTLDSHSSKWREITKRAYQKMDEKTLPPSFFNISHIFDTENRPIYLDWCQISGESNKKVAEEMVSRMEI